MSPHLMLENTTWVSGCWDCILAGLPCPLWQGPFAPESSHAICWAGSFQILIASTTRQLTMLANCTHMLSEPQTAWNLQQENKDLGMGTIVWSWVGTHFHGRERHPCQPTRRFPHLHSWKLFPHHWSAGHFAHIGVKSARGFLRCFGIELLP